MAKKFTKELKRLIDRANKKLEQAKYARYDVENYLEEHYGIDTYENYELFEDRMTWCYGINAGRIEDFIKDMEEDD